MATFRKKLNDMLNLIAAGGIPIIMVVFTLFLFGLLLFPINYVWLVPYFIYIYFDDTPERGGRRISSFYNSSFYARIRKYFNVQLVREKELDPTKNYMLCYHPHGIWGLGCQGTFRPSNRQFAELFPGIDVTVLTLNANFSLPIYREFTLALGYASVSRRSITHLLQQGSGRSVILVPGGGAEALHAQDSSANLVLQKRFGFVKVAIETGADLVPVYGFGETSAFTVWDATGNPIFDTFQAICARGGFRFPLFFGTGFKEGSLGFFPHKTQITVVVGAPISVTKNANPTNEEVMKLHGVYCDSLKALYNKYKEQYHVGPLPVPELQLL